MSTNKSMNEIAEDVEYSSTFSKDKSSSSSSSKMIKCLNRILGSTNIKDLLLNMN
jgi:hypothetical protein